MAKSSKYSFILNGGRSTIKKYSPKNESKLQARVKASISNLKVSRKTFKNDFYEGSTNGKGKARQHFKKELGVFRMKSIGRASEIVIGGNDRIKKYGKLCNVFSDKVSKYSQADKANAGSRKVCKLIRKHAPNVVSAAIITNNTKVFNDDAISGIFKDDIKRYSKSLNDESLAKSLSIMFPRKANMIGVSNRLAKAVIGGIIDSETENGFKDVVSKIFKISKIDISKKEFSYELVRTILKLSGAIWAVKGASSNRKDAIESCREWTLNTINKMDKADIQRLMKWYLRLRKREVEQNIDKEHLIPFSQHVDSTNFPRLGRVLKKFIAEHSCGQLMK